MKSTFADSFYFLALFNPDDAAHDRAVDLSQRLVGNLLTTDWILAEVADALSGAANRGACIEMIDDLRHSSRIEVLPATRTNFESGWELFGKRHDKDWSLTDCISFVVMQEHGVTDALTGDRHFEQAGFQALLRE
ncbi:MAG: type II toxin-antitoxin system VapC family toxin [Pirellulales bacterium]